MAELKSRSADGQRFSFTATRQICQQARVNRGAAACILIADTAEILPDGLSFGQLSPVDYFTAFDGETGDDTGIAVAIRLAMVAAIGTVETLEAEAVDKAAAGEVIGQVRALVDRLSKVEAQHTSAKRAIDSAGRYLDDLKARIQALLRRLDEILGP